MLIDKGEQINQFKVDGKSRKFFFVTAIKEIEPDVFIMGTLSQGLHKYDMKKETLKTISSAELNLPEKREAGNCQYDPDRFITKYMGFIFWLWHLSF